MYMYQVSRYIIINKTIKPFPFFKIPSLSLHFSNSRLYTRLKQFVAHSISIRKQDSDDPSKDCFQNCPTAEQSLGFQIWGFLFLSISLSDLFSETPNSGDASTPKPPAPPL